MDENDDHGSSKGSLSSIWHRGKEKMGIGSGKSVKFMPNLTPGEGSANEQVGTETDSLTPKQRRRAQVRKAQIEHRQRKENYVKHLEKDVTDLREMIAASTTQSAILKHENMAIRDTIAKAQLVNKIPHQTVALPAPPRASQYYEPLDFSSFNQDYEIELAPQPELQPHLDVWDMSHSSSSLVSTCFDEFLDASCLQISPMFNQDILMGDGPISPTDHSILTTSASTTAIPSPRAGLYKSTDIDLSTMAINFILALEHPCRTHFQAPASAFAPNGPPSGHELMASTLVYSSAPNTVFSSPSFKNPAVLPPSSSIHSHTHTHDLSWETPSSPSTSATALTLENLQAMASSLPKNDWELTPVQAWFLLSSRYPAHTLLACSDDAQASVLGRLKSGLGKIVDCFEFGAVMDEARFWDVVERELGMELGPGLLVT